VSDELDAINMVENMILINLFFEQIKGLMYEVGLPHLSNVEPIINSPYCGNVGQIKDCYWIFNAGMSENCAYGTDVNGCKDSYDLLTVNNSELSYNLFGCGECYQVFFSTECRESSNIWFSKNLVNCHNCFGCVNLRHKKYHIFNKPYSKEEYENKIKGFNLSSYKSITEIKEKAKEFYLKISK